MMSIQESAFVVIQPHGHLDAQGSVRLKQQFAEIQPEIHELWIVDMNAVQFVDSAGLLCLVNGLKLANRNQCRLFLCNLHPAVRLIFEISQLDQIFTIIDSQVDVEKIHSNIAELADVNPTKQIAA